MVIKDLLTKKRPGPDDFTGQSHKIFKEEILILEKLRKYRRKKYFFLYHPDSKPRQRNHKMKKNMQINIPHEPGYKNL